MQHAGNLIVQHNVLLDCSTGTVNVVKEFQKIVLVVVAGWVTVTAIRSLSARGPKTT